MEKQLKIISNTRCSLKIIETLLLEAFPDLADGL